MSLSVENISPYREYKLIDPIKSMVGIMLHPVCNMKCSYCYQKDIMSVSQKQKDIYLSFVEKASEFINFLSINGEDGIVVSIEGGEPFVMIEVLEKFLEKLSNNNKDQNTYHKEIIIVTNMTQLDSMIYILDKFKNLNITLNPSIHYHEIDKKQLYDTISNILKLKKYIKYVRAILKLGTDSVPKTLRPLLRILEDNNIEVDIASIMFTGQKNELNKLFKLPSLEKMSIKNQFKNGIYNSNEFFNPLNTTLGIKCTSYCWFIYSNGDVIMHECKNRGKPKNIYTDPFENIQNMPNTVICGSMNCDQCDFYDKWDSWEQWGCEWNPNEDYNK